MSDREAEDHADSIFPGDPEESAVIHVHRAWVGTIARAWSRRGIDVQELEAAGLEGLLIAWRRFEPARGVHFKTYARHWVQAHMQRQIQRTGVFGGRGGRDLRRLRANYDREWSKRRTLEQAVDDRSLAGALDVSTERVAEYRTFQGYVSEPYDSNTEMLGFAGPRASAPDPCRLDRLDPEELASTRRLHQTIAALFDEFESSLVDGRQRAIWHERLRSHQPVSQGALGSRWGVSKQRVSQLEHRLLGRLAQFVRAQPEAVQLALREHLRSAAAL